MPDGRELPQQDDGDATPELTVLESCVRLSESILWDRQRRFFSDFGTAAWTQGEVPWWVTTNKSMALAYARVALAFLQDCLADGLLPQERPLRNRFGRAAVRASPSLIAFQTLSKALPGR